jgi:Tfp pilus assembly protein PilF/SAM-dependent methyltransferase
MLEAAVRLLGSGQLAEAEAAYRAILARDPQHAESLYHLGIIATQLGRHDVAIELIGKALALNDRNHEAHHAIGLAHHLRGHQETGLFHFHRAIQLEPNYADAHVTLAALHQQQGELDEAATYYRQALSLRPDHAEANYNFGVLLEVQGKWDEATARYRRVLSVKPDHARAHLHLCNLTASHALRELDAAPDAAAHVPPIAETNEAEEILLRRSGALPPPADFDQLRSFTIRALSGGWGDPSIFRALGVKLVHHTAGTADCIARAQAAWPNRLTTADLFGPHGITAICNDELLCTLLESTQLTDLGLERFLTAVRRAMLELAAATFHSGNAEDHVLRFHCALASQCFINEYVYDLFDDERNLAQLMWEALAASLASGDPVPPAWLPAVAAYFPLHGIPAADTLLGRSWPDAVSALLDLQVRQPLEERAIAPTIPRLTAIDDHVSLLVQQQYEQNPYPRWTKLSPAPEPLQPAAWLRGTFPSVTCPELAGRSSLDILIAGCGTGQHSIQTARRLAQTRVLAVDLSLTSLCYAQRRTRALGLSHVEYAQADILKLGSIGRTFDIIESGGVLHHLEDPMAGWRVLLSLLRPGGLMLLGFYSELARRHIVAARAFIAERGYGRTADDIRRCRQDLLAAGDEACQPLTKFKDFFSISDCRDLLFHVQEHRLTLPQIKSFLVENHLTLVRFNVDAEAGKKFMLRFPAEPAMRDIDAWHVFETENPDTFANMYQFWVRKDGPARAGAPASEPRTD